MLFSAQTSLKRQFSQSAQEITDLLLIAVAYLSNCFQINLNFISGSVYCRNQLEIFRVDIALEFRECIELFGVVNTSVCVSSANWNFPFGILSFQIVIRVVFLEEAAKILGINDAILVALRSNKLCVAGPNSHAELDGCLSTCSFSFG